MNRIRINLYLAGFFHDHVITLGAILGILAICFMVAAGR